MCVMCDKGTCTKTHREMWRFTTLTNSAAALLALAFSLPVLGFVAHVLARSVQYFVSGLFCSIPEITLALLHIFPTKHIRLCVVILRDEHGYPVCEPSTVLPFVHFAIEVFKSARISIEPVCTACMSLDAETKYTAGLICVSAHASSPELLDSVCGRFWPIGRARTEMNRLCVRHCFSQQWRRLIGYGGPITVCAVRSIQGGKLGWSGRVLNDVTLVDFNIQSGGAHYLMTLAHEVAHTCGLSHQSDAGNLMNSTLRIALPQNVRLGIEQICRLRMSPHVTYW